jgi:uncharacterized protein
VGERNFLTLLREMQPELDPHEWVFCSVDAAGVGDLNPVASFREDEGLTVVIDAAVAREKGLDALFPSRRIILRVHSDLSAVGFLAVVTTELAKHGIATNVFSAMYHDHVFVPANRAVEALLILQALSSEAR